MTNFLSFKNCNFSAMIFDNIDRSRAHSLHPHTFLSSCIPFTPSKLSLVHFLLLCCCCCRCGCHHPIMTRYSFLHKRIYRIVSYRICLKSKMKSTEKMHHSIYLSVIAYLCVVVIVVFSTRFSHLCTQRMNART